MTEVPDEAFAAPDVENLGRPRAAANAERRAKKTEEIGALPAAGPHADPALTDDTSTPGTGALPSSTAKRELDPASD
jgi:hypothetical protein